MSEEYVNENEEDIKKNNNNKMIEEISWEDFKNSKMLWWINQQLHLFNLALTYEYDKEGNLIKVFPAKCKFRGFSESVNTEGYKKLTEYLNNNMDGMLDSVK